MSGIKLSAAQNDALVFIRDYGYECGFYDGLNGYACLQQGGLGRGGTVKNINISTLHCLLDKGIIQKVPNQERFARPTRYELTELGKTIKI